MITRRAQVLWLAAAAALVSACASLTQLAYSNVALAYSNLPPMLAWMVDDYVDLSGLQKDWMRERLARVMAWHRTEELPEYRRFLESVLARSDAPFAEADIAAHYDELRARYRRLVEQVIPDVAEFLSRIDAEQLAQLERKFARDNREFVRESVKGSPEARRERRVKRFLAHVEGWVGSVSEAQRALVERHYEGVQDLVDERLGDRRFRQVETLALIRARPSREEMVAGLRRLFVDTETWRRPEYAGKLRERERRMFAMLAALSATLTPEQRDHLKDRLRGYIRDVTELSASS